MKSDLIDRQRAIEEIERFDGYLDEDMVDRIKIAIGRLPSAESEIIRCEDCKWWDQKFDDSPTGYCMAAKHNFYSSHWEINIQRTYGKNFFCADAEPKEDEEEEDE